MKPFKFRAAAALELRRREEHDAGAALARATAHFHEAKSASATIEQQRAAAQKTAAAQAGRGIDAASYAWHRNWIVRLQLTLDQLRVEVHRRALAMEHAERQWRLARRRRMALDRLHDRALARYRAEELRQELKVIDELARLRHAMADAGREQEEL
jgi:flagellar export protein FliJ